MEVLYDNHWGTICSYDWDHSDAQVICKHLGYANGTAHRNSLFAQGEGPVWTTAVNCSGSESNLEQCKPTWGGVLCSHYKDASVICVNGKSPNSHLCNSVPAVSL